MKTRTLGFCILVFFSCLCAIPQYSADWSTIDLIPLPAPPPPPPPTRVWQYTLLPDSQLTDECLICGRPPIIVPMRGTFQLRLLEGNPLFARYAVEAISFKAGSAPGFEYRVSGRGTFGTGVMLGRGDLLSSRGVIVKKNAQLLARFHPADPKKDYGLDALYVVFGNVLRLDLTPSGSKLVISWDSSVAVLQEADTVAGPWRDVSPDPLPSPYVLEQPSGTKFFRLNEP